jgi:hypothetical protein
MQIPRPTPTCARFRTTEVPCGKCGQEMRLILVEPRGRKLELLTYQCAPCDSDESFLMTK